MAHIFDVIPPTVVSDKEFADAMNDSCSYRTERGQQLSMLEIVVLRNYQLEKEVRDLRAMIEAMQAGK